MAIDHKFSNTDAVSILELLQTNATFMVPKFQRNYSWDQERVEALWSDMLDNFMVYQNNPESIQEAQYLLGPVVLVKGERQSEFFVIDGQQRLSTLTILFCVARDIILERIDPDKNTQPEGIEKIRELIENTSMGERKGWKLVLNDTDRDLFREIQEYENCKSTQLERIRKSSIKIKSHEYLENTYVFLYEKIMDSLITGFNDKNKPNEIKQGKTNEEIDRICIENIKMLNYFLAYIRECNFVVKIMVADNNTAFQIFETLNERGQTLSKSNLIKNHILSKVNSKNSDMQQELSAKWNKIFDDVIGQGQRDDEFLMESLRSRHPLDYKDSKDKKYKISIKNLYKIIHDQIEDEQTCKQYIKNLKEDADFLSTLNNPNTYEDDKTLDDIRALKILNAKFIRTPILAAYRKWGMNSDYQKLVSFLVKFFFKFRTIRQKLAGDVEEITLDVTQKILNDESLSSIIKKIKTNDNHVDFNWDFKQRMEDPKKAIAPKYILQQITYYLGDVDSDIRPIEGLTLEHILPKKYEKFWKEEEFFESSNAEQRMKDYVSRLGNMTLLIGANNASVTNKPFEEKKKKYKESRLSINQETVVNQDKWTSKVIEEREIKFADYADKIWNLDSY